MFSNMVSILQEDIKFKIDITKFLFRLSDRRETKRSVHIGCSNLSKKLINREVFKNIKKTCH